MQYTKILVEIENNIALVTINRPEALNALNKEVLAELGYFCKNELLSHQVKGVIITGSGEKAFVAGADITEFLEIEKGTGHHLVAAGNIVFDTLEASGKPVIAAVNGFALGGGCELAMACHMRIAGEKARFGMPEVSLGLIPGYGGTQRLPQLVGKGKALELIMTGDMVNAADALSLGLANHVVPQGQEVEKAKQVLQTIFTKGPLAVAHGIAAVNAYYHNEINGFNDESRRFGELTATQDFVEGATAFVQKRKAMFTGK